MGAAQRLRRRAGDCQALRHDVRDPLPFDDASFDACYSHMLFCMALTTAELERPSREVCRALKPGGLHVYTLRHTGDAQYGAGIARGDDVFESAGGFAVHFCSRETAQHLATGFDTMSVDEFEEGVLPRQLFRVTLRKIRPSPEGCRPQYEGAADQNTVDGGFFCCVKFDAWAKIIPYAGYGVKPAFPRFPGALRAVEVAMPGAATF